MGDVWRFPSPFSRRNRSRRDLIEAAVAAFWQRWEQLRPTVGLALDSGELHAVEPRVAAAVAGLHRRLGWSLAGGSGDAGDNTAERHVLVVTGEGDEELRELTDAWLAAAPSDPGWEYHDAAQPLEDPGEVVLGIGELQVALADVRVRALADGEVLHVAVFHPSLAELAGEDRDVLSIVALDTTLGERLVERRIGCVEPVDVEPAQAMDLMGLRGLVVALDLAETTTAAVCPTG